MSSLPFPETRGPWKKAKADYHSINKTRPNVKQEQKQKAASVFSPRKGLCQQPLYVTQTLTHACAQPGNGIVAQEASFIQPEGRKGEEGAIEEGKKRRTVMMLSNNSHRGDTGVTL